MSDEPQLHRGLPDRNETVALLNEAYGDWGDEEVLRWKYDQYPGFEEEHIFYLTVDGELAAFRRLFDKEILSSGVSEFEFFVLGDTCVSVDHRGEGLYSKLHSETTKYSQQQGRDFSCTFNRDNNLTYKANLDRGWQYRTLPIWLRILSPETVLQQYAQLVLEDDRKITALLNRVGHRIGLSFDDGKLLGSDLINREKKEPLGALYFPLPDFVVISLVEIASGKSPTEAIKHRIQPDDLRNHRENITATVRERPFDEGFVQRLAELYNSANSRCEFYFRRDIQDIQHLLAYPSLEAVITATKDCKLVGAAPVCLDTNGAVLELQILDLPINDADALSNILSSIESVATKKDVDLIIGISNYELGMKWAQVNRQVMMWDEYGTNTTALTERSLRIGLYDVA